MSRQPSTLTGFNYAARLQRDSGNTSTTNIQLWHTVETANSLTFAGGPVNISFYARAGANYSAASQLLNVVLATGTGVDQAIYSFTGYTEILNTNATLKTTWERFTFTVPVSTLVKQIGLQIRTTPVGTAGANDWFEITGIQLEAGTVATPFRRNAPSIQAELAACQRYYEKSYDSTVSPGTNTNIGSQMLPPYNPSNDLSAYAVNFQVEKRAAPTMSLYAPDGTINRVHIVDAGVNTSTNTTARDVGTRGFRGWLAGGTSGAPSDKRTLLHYIASAEL